MKSPASTSTQSSVEPVDGLALQHVEAVLHDVGLGEGDHRAGLEGDDVDVHVVAQVGRIDEARRRPAPVGAGHGVAHHVLLVGDEGLGRVDALDRLVALADPVEGHAALRGVCAFPVAGRRQEGVAARPQQMARALDRQRQVALDDEEDALGARRRARAASLPPPASTSMMYCEKVSAKPDIGRAMIQARVLSQSGR